MAIFHLIARPYCHPQWAEIKDIFFFFLPFWVFVSPKLPTERRNSCLLGGRVPQTQSSVFYVFIYELTITVNHCVVSLHIRSQQRLKSVTIIFHDYLYYPQLMEVHLAVFLSLSWQRLHGLPAKCPRDRQHSMPLLSWCYPSDAYPSYPSQGWGLMHRAVDLSFVISCDRPVCCLNFKAIGPISQFNYS